MARAVRCVDAARSALAVLRGRLMTIGHLVIIWPRPEPAVCADGLLERRTDEHHGAVDARFLQVGQRGRVGSARRSPGTGLGRPRLGVGGGHVEQRRQPRSPGRLTPSPTAPATRPSRAEPPTTMGGTGPGRRKPRGPTVASPHRSERGDLVGDLRPTASIARHLTPKCLLLGPYGVSRPHRPRCRAGVARR